MAVIPFQSHQPTIAPTTWIAPDSWVIGAVSLGERCSVFFGAVLRGDILPLTIGDGTNIQEGSMLHTSHGVKPCVVGRNVTVGHHAIIHGCSVGDECIIGMGTTILDGAEIGSHCIIGANSLIPMNATIPAGSMVYGSPAKVIRPLRPEEIVAIQSSATSYQNLGRHYLKAFDGREE